MKFDFDYAKHLAETDPAALEAYRRRLLTNYLESLPPHRAARLLALQAEIDAAASAAPPLAHLAWLGEALRRRLDALTAAFWRLDGALNPGREVIRGYACKRRSPP